jgi:hypothetical protein
MLTTTMLLLALNGPLAWNDPPPPPPPPMEHVRPRRGWVWIEGGVEWRHGRYHRLPGHWERQRPGRAWHSGRWDWRGDHYEWIPGAWIEGPAYVAPPELVRNDPPPPPPPPPRAAPPPPPPRPGFVWIPGNQEWRDNHYVWVEGHWERERPGDTWNPGHWDHDGARHAWHPSGWEHGWRDHDHDHERDHERDHDRDHDRDRAFAPGITISGRIADRVGRPIPGIQVVLAGSAEGQIATDGDGRYAFTGLAPGSYAVRPTEPRCGFGPDVVNLNNLGSSAVQNFTANCR